MTLPCGSGSGGVASRNPARYDAPDCLAAPGFSVHLAIYSLGRRISDGLLVGPISAFCPLNWSISPRHLQKADPHLATLRECRLERRPVSTGGHHGWWPIRMTSPAHSIRIGELPRVSKSKRIQRYSPLPLASRWLCADGGNSWKRALYHRSPHQMFLSPPGSDRPSGRITCDPTRYSPL